jgi:hypothetical protein
LRPIAGAGACLAADKGQAYPSEAKRYADEATENYVVRLTDPAHQSWLPACYNRAISRKSDFLIYSSDRSGIRAGLSVGFEKRPVAGLTEAAPDLVHGSLTLAPDEREFAYLAGRSLSMGRLNGEHTREVYRLEEGFSSDAGSAFPKMAWFPRWWKKAGMSRLRLITMRTGAAATLVESPDPISDPQPRPKRAGLLYRKSGELWVVNYDAGAESQAAHRTGRPWDSACGPLMEEPSII